MSASVSPGDIALSPTERSKRRPTVQFGARLEVDGDDGASNQGEQPFTSNYDGNEDATSTNDNDYDDDKGRDDDNDDDPRLANALQLVRKMSEPDLKEQCVRTEWGGLTSTSEKDILLVAIQDPTFWREVKDNTARDIEAAPEDDSDVDTKERLRQMFLCFDRTGTGKIDASQMQRMLLYMGVSATEREVMGVVSTVDSDDDGFITSDEFVEIMERAQAGELAIEAPSKSNIKRASFRLQSKRTDV